MALYRLADFCIVSSLHDGMNLVAKEFVAARDDLGGVLVLSEMTGAAQELTDALIINPYDVEGFAGAIERAIYDADPTSAAPDARAAPGRRRSRRLSSGRRTSSKVSSELQDDPQPDPPWSVRRSRSADPSGVARTARRNVRR